MDKMIKECMKPHALMHTVTGIALGLLLAGFLDGSKIMLGVILLVVGILGDTMMQSKK